jgi:hypothetical protein
MSTASTSAAGKYAADARAMQPDPVPRSRMRRTRSGFTQGEKRLSISSAMGERGTSTRLSM